MWRGCMELQQQQNEAPVAANDPVRAVADAFDWKEAERYANENEHELKIK